MYDKDNEIKIRNLIKALQMFPMEASVMCVDDSSGRESLITYINYNEETNQVILIMGYYTKFELYAYGAESKSPISEDREEEIAQKIWEITSGSDRYKPRNFEDCFGDTMKWYDHEENMIALSKEYPNILFVLEGIGEEFPDAWRKWFHNGKFEESYAEITYPRPVNPLFAEFNF